MSTYRSYTSGQNCRNGCTRQVTPGAAPAADCPLPAEASCKVRSEQGDLADLPIAMAYTPWQEWKNIYKAEKAFQRGTIFEELDKPFGGTGGCCNGRS